MTNSFEWGKTPEELQEGGNAIRAQQEMDGKINEVADLLTGILIREIDGLSSRNNFPIGPENMAKALEKAAMEVRKKLEALK